MQATIESQRPRDNSRERRKSRDAVTARKRDKERQVRREKEMRGKGESSNEDKGHGGETDTLEHQGRLPGGGAQEGEASNRYMGLGKGDRQEKEQGPGGGLEI